MPAMSSTRVPCPVCRAVLVSFLAALSAVVPGCATESSRALEPQSVAARYTPYSGPKYRVVIGKIDNKSGYGSGIFADDPNSLGMQARQILKNHLVQSGRFVVLERANLEELGREATLAGREQVITAGQVVLTGAVTEFGRKTTGGRVLGGILGRSKNQVAYCKISISVADVSDSTLLFSAQGAGEYQLSNAEVLGTGGTAGYDSTLNDKVLNLAMMEVVQRLCEAVESGEWKPR